MAKPKSDRGHQLTDQMLTDLEKRLHDEYEKAANEIQLKLDDYMKRFRTKDKIWQKWVDKGVKTQEEYQEWRIGQLAMGERWEKMKDRIVSDQTNANRIARQITNREMPSIFALNANYAIYQAEHDARIDTSLTLYNREAVDRILRDDPDLLLPPGKKVSQQIKTKKAVRWEKQKIQSVMMQGIMQGESIPTIAARLSEEVAMMDYKAAVRNARTMATNAQNAGRYDAYERLQNNGVDLTLEWAATLDDRTRHEHRLMHGQRRDVGEPFVVDGIEIMYPAQTGDFMGVRESDIPQQLIWNCRCTLLAWVKGFEHDTIKESDKMGDMTFDEWLEAKENPQDILHQYETGKDIREDYIRRYAFPYEPGEGGAPDGGSSHSEEELEKVPRFKPAETVEEANGYGTNMLGGNYEKHRIENNMTSVPRAELEGSGVFSVNYGKMSIESANAFNETLGGLTSDYDSPLTKIRTMTKMEFMGNRNAFAYVHHDYTTDTAQLVINPTKCKDLSALVERITQLSEDGYCVKIKDGNAVQYVATHEFAHAILNLEQPLRDKTNWVNADYAKLRAAREEINGIYDKYVEHVGELSKKRSDLELQIIMETDIARAEKLGKVFFEADKELQEYKLSDYSLLNADEFMAEAFTNERIGAESNHYGREVMKVMDKYFRR